MAKSRGEIISLVAKVYGFNELKPKKRTVVYKQKEHTPGYALYIYKAGELKQKVEVSRHSVRGHFMKSQLCSAGGRKGLGGGRRQRVVTSLVLLYEVSPLVLQVTSNMDNTSTNGKALAVLSEMINKELKQDATFEVNIQGNDCIHHTGPAQVYVTESHLCMSEPVSQWGNQPRNTPTALVTWPWSRVCDIKYYHMGQSRQEGLSLRIRTTDTTSTQSFSFTCENAEELYRIFQSLRDGGGSQEPQQNPAKNLTPESADLYINWRELNSILHQNPVYHTRSQEYLPACDERRDWADCLLVTYVTAVQDYLPEVSRRTPLASLITPHIRTRSLSVGDLRRCPAPTLTLPPDDLSVSVPPPPVECLPQISRPQRQYITISRGSIITAKQKNDGQNTIVESYLNWRKEQASFMFRGFPGDRCNNPVNGAGSTPPFEYDENSIYTPFTNLVMILTCDHCGQIPNRLQLSRRARHVLSWWLMKTNRDDAGANWEDLAHAIGLCDQTVDFIKKCAYNRKLDYYEAELVLKYWEYYDKPDFPFDLKPCSWDTLVSLLQNLGRYDVVDLLQDRRQQRP